MIIDIFMMRLGRERYCNAQSWRLSSLVISWDDNYSQDAPLCLQCRRISFYQREYLLRLVRREYSRISIELLLVPKVSSTINVHQSGRHSDNSRTKYRGSGGCESITWTESQMWKYNLGMLDCLLSQFEYLL